MQFDRQKQYKIFKYLTVNGFQFRWGLPKVAQLTDNKLALVYLIAKHRRVKTALLQSMITPFHDAYMRHQKSRSSFYFNEVIIQVAWSVFGYVISKSIIEGDIGVSMQDCAITIASALEILQSCTMQSMFV